MRADDIADQSAIAFGSPFPGVPFHAEVLALDVAQATELLEKRAVRVATTGWVCALGWVVLKLI
jgi:hypothetical protein